MPAVESLDNFDKDKANAKAFAYDLVMNGFELGGGSQRITNIDIQQRMFDAVGLSKETIEANFDIDVNEDIHYESKVHGRKESLILREITLILEKELNNEILRNLSIAEVQLSKDSQLAKIYYSFLAINEDINLETIEFELDRNVKRIRMILAHKLKSRTVQNLNLFMIQV
ncbi:hypothetical protein FQA39_LY12879 [Lamprigera yunnana]|nr:hypothetical protein FQA39_LY12879 [Lamprigera yunnana]